MNAAMEMLRNKAQQLYDAIAGESNIELLIDPVEEPVSLNSKLTVTAHIDNLCNQELSDGLMRMGNPPLDPSLEHLRWVYEHQGKMKVWIYNVSPREYVLGNSLVKRLPVPACENAEYAVVTSLPAVFIHSKEDINTNAMDYLIYDGRRVAMDLINPSNLGTDQDVDTNAFRWASAVGNDFSKKGVFFSTHNPPLKKELKAAHKRLKNYYTNLIEQAEVIRLTQLRATAPALGVTVGEIVAAQQYMEDSNGNK
jgi:hypothetical protein